MADIIGSLGSQATSFVNAGFVILFGLGIAGVLYGLYWYIKNRIMRYNYNVIVLKRDSTGHLHVYKDKGGIFYDKKRELKLFYLKSPKNKSTGLSADFVPYVLDEKAKPTVFLLKTGETSYRYLNYDTLRDNPEYFRISVGEEDINTAIATINAENNKYNTDMIKFWAITAIFFVMVLGMAFMGWKMIQTIQDGVKGNVEMRQLDYETQKMTLNITQNLLTLEGLKRLNGTTIIR